MANLYIFPPNRATLNSGSLATSANQQTMIDELQIDVVDFLDAPAGPVLDASSNNIPASASNPLQVVASLASAVTHLRFGDTTGEYIGVYSGAVLSEVLETIIQPGDDGLVPCRLPAGTRISLRNMGASAIVSGNLSIQFLG